MYLICASYNYFIDHFLFMCFVIYFIVYSNYSNFVAAHDVDIYT